MILIVNESKKSKNAIGPMTIFKPGLFFLGQKIVRLWWCARAHKAPRLHQGVSLPRPA